MSYQLHPDERFRICEDFRGLVFAVKNGATEEQIEARQLLLMSTVTDIIDGNTRELQALKIRTKLDELIDHEKNAVELVELRALVAEMKHVLRRA